MRQSGLVDDLHRRVVGSRPDGAIGFTVNFHNVCSYVGWVERSDTQQKPLMVIALLNPSYACLLLPIFNPLRTRIAQTPCARASPALHARRYPAGRSRSSIPRRF